MQRQPHRGREMRERWYRASMGERFKSWLVSVKESDLWIGVAPESWRPEMEEEALRALLEAREHIEEYGNTLSASAAQPQSHTLEAPRAFLTSLTPLPDDPLAPPVVRSMLKAGIVAGVGPMAAVAGAVAEHVGRKLVNSFHCKEIIIENGGDLWLSFVQPLDIALFAGTSALSGLVAIELDPSLSPCGLCTSSGTVGPSLSFGYADAAAILCSDAASADAWATATGNMIQTADDIQPVLSSLKNRKEILGVLIVVGDRMGIQGSLRLKPRMPGNLH